MLCITSGAVEGDMPTYYSTHHLHVTIIANNSQVLTEDKTHQAPSVKFVGRFLTVSYRYSNNQYCQALHNLQGEGRDPT